MSKEEDKPLQDIGTLGDHKTTPNTVLTHDQIKRRCSRFFTKLLINHSPKEIADYFFELVYETHNSKNDKRLDVWIEEFDEKYNSKESEE
jgi:hypothetical protein